MLSVAEVLRSEAMTAEQLSSSFGGGGFAEAPTFVDEDGYEVIEWEEPDESQIATITELDEFIKRANTLHLGKGR